MKTYSILLFCLLTFTGMLSADENEKELEALANKIIDAIKTNNYNDFEKCWADPDELIKYINTITSEEDKKKIPTDLKKYFVNSRKAIKPFYEELQSNIKKFGHENSDIVFKSMECKIRHDKSRGYSINNMSIFFYFGKDDKKLYKIKIDDAYKLNHKTWLFTDKPIENIKE